MYDSLIALEQYYDPSGRWVGAKVGSQEILTKYENSAIDIIEINDRTKTKIFQVLYDHRKRLPSVPSLFFA